jgi:hypothetical protein
MGLLGLHELGGAGGQWLVVDLLWGIGGGLGIGWLLGAWVSTLILHLRTRHGHAIGLNEFLALGLIALVYGIALLAHASGFLAVFAAGLALPRMRPMHEADSRPRLPVAMTPGAGAEIEIGEASAPANATHPVKAPAHMAQAVLSFDEQLERFAEIAMVLAVGAMFSYAVIPPRALVRAAAAPGDPAGQHTHRWRAGDVYPRSAAADRMVRHTRHRFGLLSAVRGKPWPARRGGADGHRPDPGHRRDVDRRARRLDSAADEPLSSPQGRRASSNRARWRTSSAQTRRAINARSSGTQTVRRF